MSKHIAKCLAVRALSTVTQQISTFTFCRDYSGDGDVWYKKVHRDSFLIFLVGLHWGLISKLCWSLNSNVCAYSEIFPLFSLNDLALLLLRGLSPFSVSTCSILAAVTSKTSLAEDVDRTVAPTKAVSEAEQAAFAKMQVGFVGTCTEEYQLCPFSHPNMLLSQ